MTIAKNFGALSFGAEPNALTGSNINFGAATSFGRSASTVKKPGSPLAKDLINCGISLGIPAPIKTASTSASIAP